MKSKCLNAKPTSFCHWGFELYLTFELCNLTFFETWALSFVIIWKYGFYSRLTSHEAIL
jgi:hypothetical protein